MGTEGYSQDFLLQFQFDSLLSIKLGFPVSKRLTVNVNYMSLNEWNFFSSDGNIMAIYEINKIQC